MLRLTDIKLHLNHEEKALAKADLATLGKDAEPLKTLNVYKRRYDARDEKEIQLSSTTDGDVSEGNRLVEKYTKKTESSPTPGRAKQL